VALKETFVDGIGNVAVQGTFARLELTQLDRLPAAGETPVFQVGERLVMGIDTLLRLHQALQKIVEQLEQKGVVKKNDKAAQPDKPQAKPSKQ
jgi:hypothetical protein